MSDDKKHTGIRALKIIGWIVLTIMLLLAILRFSMKWDWVHDIARKQVISIGNQSLNGTLSIEKIDGDLWKDFKLSNILISDQDTSILAVDSIHVQYNIWSLLNKTFDASSINLSGINAHLRETNQNEFNIQQIAKTDTSGSASSSFGIIIDSLRINDGSLFIQSPTYLPDSTLTINELQVRGGLKLTDATSASLKSLTFKICEGRLPEPIAIKTSGSFTDDLISLDQLFLETGRSLLQAHAFSNLQDSSLAAEVEALPFSLQDLRPYLDTELPEDNLNLTLEAGGTIDSLHVRLRAESNGFDELLLISDLSLSNGPVLHKFGITGKNLDVSYFTGDSKKAFIRDFSASAEGSITQDFKTADVTWGFTLNDIFYDDYRFEILFGSGTLIEDQLLANIQLSDGRDKIVLNPRINALWSEYPIWKVAANVSNVNLGWWLRNPDLNSNISFQSTVQGQGFELSKKAWKFSVAPRYVVLNSVLVKDSTGSNIPTIKPSFVKDTVSIAEQSFSDFDIQGTVNTDSLSVTGFLQLLDSKINLSASAGNFLSNTPNYEYQLETRKFNLNEIALLDDISSSINMEIKGEGTYFDPDQIQLNTQVLVDSSYINGAAFNLLNIQAELDKNILNIRNGDLVSEVIDGSFTGRRNIYDRTDPDNNLFLSFDVKNLQPVATLAGADTLNARGRIEGDVTEVVENELLFDGTIKLSDIRYDSLFKAQGIDGTTKISIREELGYDLSLNIDQPSFAGVSLQDLQFSSVGNSTTDSLSGVFTLDISEEEAGQLSQAGNYSLALDSLHSELSWSKFDFQTPVSFLSLQQPFNLSYKDDVLATDTLELRDNNGTFFTLSIPYADSVRQQILAAGSEFNFGVVQEIIFGERFVDGILSGNAQLHNTPDSLSGNGTLQITDLMFMESEIDQLNMGFNVAKRRMNADLSAIIDEEEKLKGHINVPFIPKRPEELDETFFEEPVEGNLVIRPLQIQDFENMLNALDITETSGLLSFDGTLSGTAGEPDFEGAFNLQSPTLSGIPIDSAFAGFNYDHLNENITVDANINARGQQAASIDARIPISMNFQTFELNMPEETDSLHFDMVTDNFNLTVFNDFLNKQYANRLRGMLNADVNISGPKNNLKPKGYLSLSNGQLLVPVAGISLENIQSEIQFTDSGLTLDRLNIKSGSGNFTGTGSVTMEGLTPTNLNLSAKAQRFKLANTADYNLTVDLDSKITGNPLRPKASGEFRIKNGFIYLQDFGERSVETVELEGEESSSFSPYDSLAVEMSFVIERDFFIRNRRYLDLEIEIDGELNAQKQTGGELQLFGALNANEGYVRPLGKQFNLEEGNVTFSGPIEDPTLFINTSYIPQSAQKEGDPIILYYIIEGNALDPEFRFESDPQMEQQDIICYTLFNKPCYALESWQQVVSGGSGSSPTDLLVGVLLDEVETLATQELGIDVVQIETTRSGTDTGTSIKTGWYLNRKTFFAIVNEISGTTPKTMFILEYMLREHLDLIITQGDDNQQGIDLRWQYDY